MATRTVVPHIEILRDGQVLQSVVLTQPRLMIGSAPDADIRLNLPRIQAHHVVIQLAEGRYLEAINLAMDPHVKHLGDPFQRVRLGHGSEIDVYGYVFLLTYVEQEAPTPPRVSAGDGEPPAPPPAVLASSPRLLVHGPDAQHRAVRLPVGSYVIGAGGCEIAVPFPGVAERHAELTVYPDGTASVEDLGSGEPTFVNRDAVARCPFRPGDLLQVGTVSFSIEAAPGAPEPPAPPPPPAPAPPPPPDPEPAHEEPFSPTTSIEIINQFDPETNIEEAEVPAEYRSAKRKRLALSCLVILFVLFVVMIVGAWQGWLYFKHRRTAKVTSGSEMLSWGEDGVPDYRRPGGGDLDPTLGKAMGGGGVGGGGGPVTASPAVRHLDSDTLGELGDMNFELDAEAAVAASRAWVDVPAVETVLRDEVTPHARMCYRRRLESSPGLAGTMNLDLVIGTDGRITAVYLNRDLSSLDDDEILECIRRAVQARTYPPAYGGPVTITYPFRFN